MATGWAFVFLIVFFLLSPLAAFFGSSWQENHATANSLTAFFAVLLQASRGKAGRGKGQNLVITLLYLVIVLLVTFLTHAPVLEKGVGPDKREWYSIVFTVVNHLIPTTAILLPLSVTARYLWAEFGHLRDFLVWMRGQVGLQTRLLNALVPTHISKRLQDGESMIADKVDQTSIMFVYICDFDDLVSGYGPKVTIQWLNEVFARLDDCVHTWESATGSVTKVETFNNFYLSVASPTPSHADDAVHAAIRMSIAATSVQRPDGKMTELKVGINSGPICAGVIGIRHPRFSIFGDAVNTASRMASLADRCTLDNIFVHLSETTAQDVGEAMQMEVKMEWGIHMAQRPDWIQVKGKGSMKPYFFHGNPTTTYAGARSAGVLSV
mmetsp:Transcript_776/g.1665  ORF Transcript_776/g.1665 Transcript_776/m.1665 type:complete len:381 (-) Transcript_776:189-1331(-)